MQNFLLWAQWITLFVTVCLILLQNRGAGLSSSFGGSDEIYLTKRGIEKTVTYMTVIGIATFCVLRIVAMFF
jgi:protein translocase SecG subunit